MTSFKKKDPIAVTLGRRGGLAKSKQKAASSRRNLILARAKLRQLNKLDKLSRSA